ncbi:hypothetical protein LFT45_22785 (plasmid) [Arthrobacter sp. FW305-BF8]|uniref:hypothetical protein n=1 Tax=Arthrobacter sp. FW305-BF8 TaxID=2879617 RepID=UPI001F1E4982|nr:hypothetical protein [Arthrobacter sp. FW305-BF8]UKA56703.1 hypothetical protein LFT45_22785 [Arthrobacter sp. FW305-BF8]
MATRFIGGESGHRSFFGGIKSTSQLIGLGGCLLIGFFGMMFTGWPGLVAGVLSGVVVYLLTASTHRGSYWERRKRRARWKERQKAGTDRFIPYSTAVWDEATALADLATSGAEKARIMAAVRSRPDGADGMGWLDARTGKPGIAWHAPAGEQPYLSVAFEVSGQLRGAESQRKQEQAQAGFGALLAGFAPASKLVSGIQSITRVLPPDLALNEAWVQDHLAADANPAAVRSYQEVLERTGRDTFVQRHLIVGRWPLTPDFYATAARYGTGRDGWRLLMAAEISSLARSLRAAKLGEVRPLTARAVVAMMLHQQNPSRPPLMVAGVRADRMGLPSRDEWNSTWITGTDPITGAEVVWGHRTAMISAENMETGERTPYWLLSLLHNAGSGARTLSFQLETVPADQARLLASKDVVRDMAAVISKQKKGQLVDPATDVNLASARARGADLMPGTGQHGVNWVGFITISARTQAGLTDAARRLEESAATAAGIGKLEWLDTYQSAASGTTWPIYRGTKPATPTLGARMMDQLAGRGEKEEKVA